MMKTGELEQKKHGAGEAGDSCTPDCQTRCIKSATPDGLPPRLIPITSFVYHNSIFTSLSYSTHLPATLVFLTSNLPRLFTCLFFYIKTGTMPINPRGVICLPSHGRLQYARGRPRILGDSPVRSQKQINPYPPLTAGLSHVSLIVLSFLLTSHIFSTGRFLHVR